MTVSLESHLELVTAIKTGRLEIVQRLVDADPTLVTDPYLDDPRSLLHHATDWPAKIANGPSIIALLVDHGADPNATYGGDEHSETPLHWAASADDVDAVNALLDHGADVDAPGGVFDGCPPIVDAVIFEQYAAAAALLERGATADLAIVAALGRLDLVEQRLTNDPAPPQNVLDRAFQWACRGGHLEVAQYLLAQGADPRATTPVNTTALHDATENGHDEVVAWLSAHLEG